MVGDEAARSAFRKPRLDRARPHEVAVGEKELEMRDRELLAVDRNHAVDHLAFALADANHVHCRTVDAHAIRGGPTDEVRDLGTSDHVLAGQTGDVWTRASNQGALDHDDGAALLCEVPRDVLAGLPAAEDDVLDLYGLSHGEAHRFTVRSPRLLAIGSGRAYSPKDQVRGTSSIIALAHNSLVITFAACSAIR